MHQRCPNSYFRCTRGENRCTQDVSVDIIDGTVAVECIDSCCSRSLKFSSCLKAKCIDFFKINKKVDVTGAVGCIDFLFNFFGGSVLALKF